MMEKTHLFETSVDPRRRQYSVAGVVTSNPAKYSRFGSSTLLGMSIGVVGLPDSLLSRGMKR